MDVKNECLGNNLNTSPLKLLIKQKRNLQSGDNMLISYISYRVLVSRIYKGLKSQNQETVKI